LAGQSLVEPKVSHTMNHSTHSCFKKTSWNKEGGIYIAAHHLQLPRKSDPTQRLGLHLVKEPSFKHCQNPHQGEGRHWSEAGTFQMAATEVKIMTDNLEIRYTSYWYRSLSKFQILVWTIQCPVQPRIFVSLTSPSWWTNDPTSFSWQY
jgi:hypothetical protein